MVPRDDIMSTNFYANKTTDLPRFLYRKLAARLAESASAEERLAVVRDFCEFVSAMQPAGDYMKMKWCLPDGGAAIGAEERGLVEETLRQKRRRRNDRLVEVYPHCGDEFSTSTTFLDAAFGSARHQLIGRATKVFTIGSCFANNIARYLQAKGYDVVPYAQAEDLNSPFSNAKMLAICAADPALRREYVDHWVNALYTEEAGLDYAAIVEGELAKLDSLARALRDSEFLIVTCGNVLDYFLNAEEGGVPGPRVAPKFLSIANNEDINARGQLTARLKQLGAEFRLGSHAEVGAALDALYQAIRSINPHANLLLTLSPIPIDSALGIQHPGKLGAVEIDCISKSLLRVALDELLDAQRGDSRLYYFPSFEIVRWIAPGIDGAVFGKEDAASRHVSQNILAGVYDYFLQKFGKDENPAAAS
jgi:hypothetical protein